MDRNKSAKRYFAIAIPIALVIIAAVICSRIFIFHNLVPEEQPEHHIKAVFIDGTWFEPISIQLKRPDGTVVTGTDWTFGTTDRTGTTRVIIDGKLYTAHVSDILLEYGPES